MDLAIEQELLHHHSETIEDNSTHDDQNDFASVHSIFEAIRQDQRFANLDQKSFAALFQMSRQNLNHYITNERIPWSNLAKFCKTNGFSLDQLINNSTLIERDVKTVNDPGLSNLKNQFIRKGGFVYKIDDWSMKPTFSRGDHLMFSPYEKDFIVPGVYLLRGTNDHLMVHRLFHRLEEEKVTVCKDHEGYPSYDIDVALVIPLIQGILTGYLRFTELGEPQAD